MLFLREFWQRRRQFFLSILSNFLSLFLLLAVSTLSQALTQGLEAQLDSMALQVNCLQYLTLETDEQTVNRNLISHYGISRYSEFNLQHQQDYDLAGCRDLSALFPLDFLMGGFFSDLQVANNENVAVLGHDIWKQLGCPLPGETIILDGGEFTVNGVLAEGVENIYFSADEMIFLPLDYCRRYQESRLFFLSEVPYFTDYLNEVLGPNNYLMFQQRLLRNNFAQILRQGRLLLQALSLFALIISLLGMMNHTLSALPGRYREIGIKKAIGARRRDIAFQFLLEALLIMVISSLSAVAANELLIKTVSLLGSLEPETDRNIYRILLLVIPVGCACCFHPAVKAARVSVSQAIRN